MTHSALSASSALSVRLLALAALTALVACAHRPAGDPAAAEPAASHSTSVAREQAAPAPDAGTFTGTVAETMDSGGYTYARLRSGEEEIWIAATRMPLATGQSLTVALNMPMRDFHSDTLERDFPLIYFVAGVAREGQAIEPPPAAPPVVVASEGPPEGGLSIADVWARRASLSGTSVTVRGTVVKVNNGIMGRNWFHLQDGSGSAEAGTHDLTVTTSAEVRLGQVVTVTGTLATRKDLGSGYSYEAILEDATIR